MGSQTQAIQELTQNAETAEGRHDCKRRRRGHERLFLSSGPLGSGAAGVPQEHSLDVSQPDWWQPQPRATLDPDDYQDRPRTSLVACLSCALCHQLLQEAIASLECGHTYCYDCIEARVDIGGNHNVCPVAGCGVVLGPSPFDHHRLVYDTLLDSLVQKIFPRPDLDAALSARRADREEATRLARAELVYLLVVFALAELLYSYFSPPIMARAMFM
ncbi:hypothetical protein VOLCADRAFT_121205 [Volvox carteri f. nagariensis]|uniref:RING-type domain-containing protein n=1 Tax=Volvox carteri f. nagariensis TaxID=3068 RepID=D8U4W7_VOLCA|nr:uncharacterized protein VOLCADRAFT_121205 [Volvox carteri f. nagariensis]EFJ45262.1 hypothetical protein VOLCADRAFT_121205 [Volvox carteri f. nagariensis]|eukprot:XP_002953638.1 hypothetical protein VOLCADRAFT_121205 [Volvox carteri f. nagariensis]